MMQNGARLVSHVYWHRKERFALEQDSYPNWTMFAVEDGRFAYRIGEQSGEAGFGDLVVCPPGTAFHRRTLSPLSFHFVHFVWQASEEKEAEWAGKQSVSDAERLSSDFRYLNRLTEAHDAASLAHREHIANDLLRLAAMERELREREPLTGLSPELERARRWLEERAYGPVDMRELAETLGFTPVQLTRRFRAAYGTTPSAYVTEQRLARASRLLEESSFSIDRIAQLCGYENGFYLSRVFRQKRGLSPSAYRSTRRV